jgi:regulator of replication initiation timing|tara:strand:+ start:2227 stop:2418 length:192 start_codon:yes stop_codon:yes gene_type:complete
MDKNTSYFDKMKKNLEANYMKLAEQTIAAVAKVKDDEINSLKNENMHLREENAKLRSASVKVN